MRGDHRGAATLATLLAAWPLLAGCAGGPPTISPGGVDGLQVPTPAPDPDDFVARVDSRWFPLEPGTRWVYRTTSTAGAGGPGGAGGAGRRVVTVADRPEVVEGVSTTVVREVSRGAGGRVRSRVEEWYAQDRAGNVWIFGRDVHGHTSAGTPAGASTGTATDPWPSSAESWRAGVDGAEAGLLVAADPRVGDGYALGDAGPAGERDVVRAEVAAVDEERTVPAGAYDDLVELEVSPVAAPGLVARWFLAAGTGLVAAESTGSREELVEGPTGPPGGSRQSG